jgi:biuret amidohydrolase
MANYIDQFTRPIAVRPQDTALVVVDMQYASGSRGRGLGAHLAREGTLADAEYRFSRIENLLIPNIRRLLDAWRAARAPVVYLKVGSRKADFSDAPPHLRAFFQVTNNYDGSEENEIVAELAPVPGEAVVFKNTMGAFAGSNIGEVYQRLGIKSAVYTGVSTNNCVDTTAREAADRGYGSILVADATGTCSDRMQDVTLESFRRLWGRVLSTDEVIAELQAAAAAARAA